ncbi:MAG: hypothetical protein ACYCQK_11025, partial [Acidiferrobacteraceae bacterium]
MSVRGTAGGFSPESREDVRIALSKGRILEDSLPLLSRAGIVPSEDPLVSRRLVLETSDPNVRLVVVRA